jgi:hypothetical protein
MRRIFRVSGRSAIHRLLIPTHWRTDTAYEPGANPVGCGRHCTQGSASHG